MPFVSKKKKKRALNPGKVTVCSYVCCFIVHEFDGIEALDFNHSTIIALGVTLVTK